MQRVFRRAQQNDLSFTAVGEQLEISLEMILNSPMPEHQIDGGREMVAQHERNRLDQMKKYAEEKGKRRPS